MIKYIDKKIKNLETMKKHPKNLYYIGNIELLEKKKISIVGSRKPDNYSRNLIHKIASQLAQGGYIIVSGGAIGIDTVAHKAAGSSNTIMVAGTGLDIRYPAINKNLIKDIEQNGLVISQFEASTPSLPRNFAIRNEIIVALSDILIVAYADLKSGTSRSINYALKMGKEIYVLPHRLGESEATNQLLAQNKAKAIYDINEFLQSLNIKTNSTKQDEFLEYCKKNPNYDKAVLKYQNKVFEYELDGKIKVEQGKIIVLEYQT